MTRVWLALLIVNVAWAGHLLVSYFLAWMACAGDSTLLMALRHLTTVVAGGASLVALWQAYRALTSSAPAPPEGVRGSTWAGEHDFLALVTVALGAMLLFGVLMAGAANLVLPACL
jgi:hypothetical protein